MTDLFSKPPASSKSIECLGLVFTNDQARRDHFSLLLAEKLKDPNFRKLEGFPSGSDEDILELSDPPHYTACPNPFIADFIRVYGKPYDPSLPYGKFPFATDVSEGKYDPLYKLHPYHTKVPHKAIMRYLLHYTRPGDLVFDGFCGTGMTGVAAQLCADKASIAELGYRVDSDGVVYQQSLESGKSEWLPFSNIGQRFAILNDLSPAAAFFSYKHNAALDLQSFERTSNQVLRSVEAECGWMYRTLHKPNQDQLTKAAIGIQEQDSPNLDLFGATGKIN